MADKAVSAEGEGRDKDDGHIAVDIPEAFEEFDAVHFRHPQIGDHQVVGGFFGKGEGLVCAGRSRDPVSLAGQHDFEKVPHALIVVNHQNLCHNSSILLQPSRRRGG